MVEDTDQLACPSILPIRQRCFTFEPRRRDDRLQGGVDLGFGAERYIQIRQVEKIVRIVLVGLHRRRFEAAGQSGAPDCGRVAWRVRRRGRAHYHRSPGAYSQALCCRLLRRLKAKALKHNAKQLSAAFNKPYCKCSKIGGAFGAP